MRRCLPKKINFLKLCVLIDPKINHTKFYSSVCSLAPSLATEIAHRSRRDPGYSLLHRCVSHAEYVQCTPRRINCMSLVLIKHDNKDVYD